MIIVNFSGQLGNQMFQYALGRHLMQLGRDVLFYKDEFNIGRPNWRFEVDRFPIHLQFCTRNQKLAMCDDRHRLIDRIRRKIIGKHPHVISEVGSKVFTFRSEIFTTEKAFLDGYWQSEMYFKDIAEIIRKEFVFPQVADVKNIALLEEIHKAMSISIHVRRGDYLGGFPVMDMSYFEPAMNYFEEKYRDVQFYVFSNDMEWCRNHIKGGNVTYVDWNCGENSINDMYLMTQCKHNIIANSSFSWWGAWLNTFTQQEVVAPKLWFYHADNHNVICPSWRLM